jgi:hypothetical protein
MASARKSKLDDVSPYVVNNLLLMDYGGLLARFAGKDYIGLSILKL